MRGQYDGYLSIDGVKPDSTTETYAALRLDIENWRWAGVPFFIRTGKRLPVTQTELRLVFKRPPKLPVFPPSRMPEPNQIVVKLDPTTGIRVIVDAHRADVGGPGRVELDVEFATQGGEGPTPYEVLLLAALEGNPMRFTRQDAVEEAWRIFQPLLDDATARAPLRARILGARGMHEARRRARQLACPVGRPEEGTMDRYDVIIIGTGAGGGTLARTLAGSGKRILLLERGDWLPREPENWLAEDVFVDNRYVSPDTWYDDAGKAFQPQVHYFVGGATKLYGAALYRLREQDFGELRHHDGISPAWPISYDELEPYYTQAEQVYEVHGARGEDPTEPPASAPYPFPARLARAAHPAALRRSRRGGPSSLPRPLRRAAARGESAL